ncbi:hypothetical protein IG631_00535 [Alternaria alternata]|nr:hypothetical protein IG631_00535 [Alternaria alternata]
MSSTSSGPFVLRRGRASASVSHANVDACSSQRTSSSLVARHTTAVASSGWNLHRVDGRCCLDGCHQRSDVRQ